MQESKQSTARDELAFREVASADIQDQYETTISRSKSNLLSKTPDMDLLNIDDEEEVSSLKCVSIVILSVLSFTI